MISYETFTKNVQELTKRVSDAAKRVGRDPQNIRILPVTKTFPIEAIAFCKKAGFQSVGENRVQEVAEKQGDYRRRMEWELIGHLQSNKARVALKHFDRVQSVDSLKLLRKLDNLATEIGTILPIMIQFNTGEDPNKYGFKPSEKNQVTEAVRDLNGIRLDGLMTIGPLSDDPGVTRRAFYELRRLKEDIESDLGSELPHLSMGMSGDLEIAVEEGSTCIRVGSFLFGQRVKGHD